MNLKHTFFIRALGRTIVHGIMHSTLHNQHADEVSGGILVDLGDIWVSLRININEYRYPGLLTRDQSLNRNRDKFLTRNGQAMVIHESIYQKRDF